MTNGEKIKAIFPNAQIDEGMLEMYVWLDHEPAQFTKDWWNAEYKEPTTKNDLGVNCTPHFISFKEMMDNLKITAEDIENAEDLEYSIEPLILPKNDLGVDCINRAELLKAMNTWDKFGNDPNEGLIPLRTPALQDRYVPYVKYDDMVKCVKGMPSVTPQEPRRGHWIKVHPLQENDEGDYMCSECRCGGLVWKPTTYCPNCGCAMVEPQESEE